MNKRRDITRSDVWDRYLRNYFLFHTCESTFHRGGLSFLFSLKLDLQAKKKQNVRNLLARGDFVNNRIKFSPEEDVLQNILSEC